MLSTRLTYVDFLLDGAESGFSVERYTGVEEISQLFRYEVTLTHPELVDFHDMVGREATLEFGFNEGEGIERYVHGVIGEFEHGGVWQGAAQYRAVIVPKLAQATLGRSSRIFLQCKANDVIGQVLGDYGVKGSCPAVESPVKYIVQYHESDWSLVQRLLEAHGFSYFFKHGENDHELIIVDGVGFPGMDGEASLIYRPDRGAMIYGGEEAVHDFVVREAPHPTQVELVDYNFTSGRDPIVGSGSRGGGPSKHPWKSTDADFAELGGPLPDQVGAAWGEMKTLGRRAKVRMGQHEWQRYTARGETSCRRVSAGRQFTLTEHPWDDANRDWVIYRVEHEGSQAVTESASATQSAHRSRFWCFDAAAQFRPLERTPKRRIWGTQTATVTRNPESNLDAAGTVAVRVHWPTANKDEIVIPFVPVSQLFAGPGHGAMFFPRIDEEVLLEFLGGDPERPVVVGRIYDGTHLPPYALPSEVSKSTIKSLSYEEGSYAEGYNELTFEDKAGSEEIYLHGQKDWKIEIENDKTQTVGHDEVLEVKNDRQKTVTGDQTETILKNKTISVTQDHTETITGNQTFTVGGNSTESVSGSVSQTIGGTQTHSVAGMQSCSVTGMASHSYAAGKTESVTGLCQASVTGNKFTTVVGAEVHEVNGGSLQTTVIGSSNEMVTGDRSILIAGTYQLAVGGAVMTIEPNGNVSVSGEKITITGSGPISVSGSKLEVTSDGSVSVEASGSVKVKGSAVDIN
ncbi:MAG: type VI secretion system tip protein VgrG [Deltaproteobacteria bacterium]|jgi:type VI secretion system secreted protein VgrG|nr:type VI secretion system tip protein VgrG [Deltaproteobacteria bacterium]MBW2530533.1 type VI secretion system tip protein VgrG [Deltaproteobacteria bacterium]